MIYYILDWEHHSKLTLVFVLTSKVITWAVFSFVEDMTMHLGEGHPHLAVWGFSGGSHRKRLFNMVNELPTVFDVVTGKKPVKDKPAVNNNSGNKVKSATKVVSAV